MNATRRHLWIACLLGQLVLAGELVATSAQADEPPPKVITHKAKKELFQPTTWLYGAKIESSARPDGPLQVVAEANSVSRPLLRPDVRVPTHIVELFRCGLLASPDLIGRAVATRDGGVQLIHDGRVRDEKTGISMPVADLEYRIMERGQKARVLVGYRTLNAPDDRNYVGRVKEMARDSQRRDLGKATVAGREIMLGDDVWPTIITIEQEVTSNGKQVPVTAGILKPGMSAIVIVDLDPPKTPVLAIPWKAVIRIDAYKSRKDVPWGRREVIVKTATGFNRRQVKLGLADEKVVEVTEGLAEGEEVVLNPRLSLVEKKDTKDDGPAKK